MDVRLEKLQQLKTQIELSKKANRSDVHAEYVKNKLNPRELIRAERKKKEAEKLIEQQKVEETGQDMLRIKGMTWSAEDVELWNQKEEEKNEKKDYGFTDYAQIAAKKYEKQVKALKPNLKEYERQKSTLQPDSDITIIDYKPSVNAVNHLQKDLEKQVEKRAKFSKRRRFNEDEEVTYINERNMRFNKKISRAYDKYTTEIKAAFERGTALD